MKVKGTFSTVTSSSNEKGEPIAIKQTPIHYPNCIIREIVMLTLVNDSEYIVNMYSYALKNQMCILYLELGTCLFYITSTLSTDDIESIASNIRKGVEYLHSKGIVHCDIKPANVIISHNKAKLIDFGCASFTPLDLTQEQPITTLEYRAPELARFYIDGTPRDNINHNIDWWSLGVMMYELGTGIRLLFNNVKTNQELIERASQVHFENKLQMHSKEYIECTRRFLNNDPLKRTLFNTFKPFTPRVTSRYIRYFTPQNDESRLAHYLFVKCMSIFDISKEERDKYIIACFDIAHMLLKWDYLDNENELDPDIEIKIVNKIDHMFNNKLSFE